MKVRIKEKGKVDIMNFLVKEKIDIIGFCE